MMGSDPYSRARARHCSMGSGGHIPSAKDVTLADLPADVLARVAGHLETDGRYMLLCTCRALWLLSRAEPDTFFESVDMRLASAAGAERAAHWLAACKAGVRHLTLWQQPHMRASALELLQRLEGGPLLSLHWDGAAGLPNPALGQHVPSCHWLPYGRQLSLGDLRMPHLRRLVLSWPTRGDGCGAPGLTLLNSLSRLSALKELWVSGYRSATLEPGCLPPSLTSLQLPDCGQRVYPPGVALPQALRRLCLHLSGFPTECYPRPNVDGLLQPLSSLTSLRLEFRGCEVDALPAALPALRALRELELCWEALQAGLQHGQGLEDEEDFDEDESEGAHLEHCSGDDLAVLAALAPSLTRLALQRMPGLEWLPHELSALSALRELDLSRCRHLSDDPEHWDWLEGLTQLRVLSLRGCWLGCIPACVWRLPCLEELDVSGNAVDLPADLLPGNSRKPAQLSNPTQPPGQSLTRLSMGWESAADIAAFFGQLPLRHLELTAMREFRWQRPSEVQQGRRSTSSLAARHHGKLKLPQQDLELLLALAAHPTLQTLGCGGAWGALRYAFAQLPGLEAAMWRLCAGAPAWFFEWAC